VLPSRLPSSEPGRRRDTAVIDEDGRPENRLHTPHTHTRTWRDNRRLVARYTAPPFVLSRRRWSWYRTMERVCRRSAAKRNDGRYLFVFSPRFRSRQPTSPAADTPSSHADCFVKIVIVFKFSSRTGLSGGREYIN